MVVLALFTVLVAAFAYAVPAQAATPNATTTRVHAAKSGADLVLTASVWSAAGVPAGTVTFYPRPSPGGPPPSPLGGPVAVDSAGAASITLPNTPDWPLNYMAEFTGAEGWANSTGYVNPFGESVKMKPIGTILHIGGPLGLKILTRTFSVKVNYASDGAPAVGEAILFTEKNRAAGASGHPGMDPNYVEPVDVCVGIVDASGYASCTAPAPMASIVTLLTTSAWANHAVFPVYESVRMPILGLG
ncbi:hypothetical protein EFK50_12540 [Nocardioides marmoriginsengisoli]|uniref:Uncharacterized protein n=2 Tax=Nocardioides marmoriginsengisoli TaxID=661483 RepID=A0A3N0CGJ8_9ACTN|nr:hypothetical protein EFK50_12540 [Nocardioides marmoriginsengisoli]